MVLWTHIVVRSVSYRGTVGRSGYPTYFVIHSPQEGSYLWAEKSECFFPFFTNRFVLVLSSPEQICPKMAPWLAVVLDKSVLGWTNQRAREPGSHFWTRAGQKMDKSVRKKKRKNIHFSQPTNVLQNGMCDVFLCNTNGDFVPQNK